MPDAHSTEPHAAGHDQEVDDVASPSPRREDVDLISAIGARDVGATVSGGITPPDHPDDPDLPENRGRRPAEQPPGVQSLRTREPLTRDRIITAAIDYVDTHGLPALTMRRLGQRLGVEAMALYRYVPSRDDLLDAVVAAVVDELYSDDDVHFTPQHGWQDYLQRLAHGVRRIALAHPALFPLVATRPSKAPWVRPPLRSLKWVESFLTALLTHGFTREQAVIAYRAYTSFLLGHLLLEVAQRGVAINAIDDPDGAPGTDVAELGGDYPVLVDLQDLLSLDETISEFEESLENLIARLGDMLTTHSSHL
ncbi:TetR/AcrR family transcriptional regulator [Klenkia sp. PcliD-1-E]|uniref:TetR/AcrR family transcriptional regulator n=1 Tax=Klenkia sp. PcliD-1-E TaxID=2954492 RepID=UPI002097B1FD|nr:TetR/AcrR family transcriptional regulator C-terminal domain-containing protein [Klenkia sp. PcliD-1-E]MCO7218342.1 TetR/AcrR family transcriptional regulator C-terminal domain-containing protein [Klenkia sp. PcliD-1-E]